MAVSFNNLPANIRVPLFYAELDNSQAGTFAFQSRSLLIGQKLAAGTAAANIPLMVTSLAQAKALFGQGSILAMMMETYRKNDSFGEVWCLPVADNGGGTAATKTLTVTGPASANGTIPLYIGGEYVGVGVRSGDTADEIAASIAAAIAEMPDLPVTAATGADPNEHVVTLTFRHKGTQGNDLDVRIAYAGPSDGEALPAGVGIVIAAGANGATDPSLTTALANLGDSEFDFIALPFTDTTVLDAVKEMMDDQTGRWSWAKQIYGGVYSAKRASVANLSTFGNARNDPHVSVMGFNDSPSPVWRWAAAYAAQAAKSLTIDPARPLQTLPLVGIKAPPISSRFTIMERQTLLFDGVATYSVRADGTVQIEREITTYQKNAYDQPDNSYLDVQTLYTAATVLRRMRQAVTSKFGRHKLAGNGTRFGAGQAITTPNIIRAELIAQYAAMEELGLVENSDLFKENLIVERNADDPTRVDILWPGDFVNQLRIFAVLAQFRLEYPTQAV
jgi:phage tail sheath gpL-like